MKKVDFLFIYEVRSREIENLSLLASELKRRGFTFAFLNSWSCLDLKYPSYDAEVLVLSACYDTGTYQFFTGHAARFRKVVNLQWEQVLKNGYVESEEPVSWDFSGDGLVTRHICWGENEKQRLMDKYNIADEFLKVCGYLTLDFYRDEFKEFFIPRQELFSQNGLDPNKTTALFISSFAMVGLPKEHTGECNEDLKRTIIENSYESQEKILEWFKKALPSHPDLQLIYRFHPTEANNPALIQLQNEYPNFFCISTETIKHWISACDKIYNWVSTSAIEVYVCKKQSFIIRPIPVPYGCDMPIFKGCNIISDFQAFEDSLSLDISTLSQPLDKALFEGYYYMSASPAYENICDYLEETHKSRDYRSHQYNLHNTGFDRLKIRLYTAFWQSSLNIFFVKLAKKTSLNIGFLNCRRDMEVPTKNKDLQKEEYRQSRAKINTADEKELLEIISKFDKIINKI